MPFVFRIGVLALALLTGFSNAGYSLVSRPDSDDGPPAAVELSYRTLQPGEIICASLRDVPGVRKAVIAFLGRTYTLEAGEAGSRFALIGIDLDTKPGSYIMKLTVNPKKRASRSEEKSLVIEPKTFPVKKLWVNEAFVNPPPSVRERIARETQILASVYAKTTPQWLGDGAFLAPHEGEASPNFGQRRIFNGQPRSVHMGIDLAVPMNEPIQASNGGTVVLASDLYFSGKTVIIDHGLGVFTLYGHMSRLLVKRGLRVKKGDIIGRCGTTGRSTGPHLHWSVRVFDARVDPLALAALPIGN